MSMHKNLNGDNLHIAKIQNGEGNPNGNIESTVKGEAYFDLLTQKFYVSIVKGSLTDWQSVTVSTEIAGGDYLDLTTGIEDPTYQEGRFFYDDVNKTMAMYNDKEDVTLQIGQETHVRVINRTGTQIDNGKVVSIVGGTDDLPNIILSIAGISNNGYLGIVTHDILDNESGIVTIQGTVSDIDTSGFSSGDVLYISSTQAGELVITPPSSPYQTIEMAQVVTSSVNGKVLVSKDIKPLTTPNENTLYVSVNGLDSSDVDGTQLKPYRTIKYTLDQITDNSSTKRYAILLMPGIFEEDNPIQLKSYVSILSIGKEITTRVVAQNNLPLFIHKNQAQMESISLQSGSTSCAISADSTGTSIYKNLSFYNCYKYLCLNHIDSEIVIEHSTSITTPINGVNTNIGYEVTSGKLKMTGNSVSSIAKIDDSIFKINGANSFVEVWGMDSDGSDVVNGIVVENGGHGTFYNLDLRNLTNGLSVQTSGFAHLIASYFENNINAMRIGESSTAGLQGVVCNTCDVDLETTHNTSSVNGIGCNLQSTKMNLHSDSIIRMAHLSNTPGDEGFEIKGELHVGTPEFPTESVFGEGDSYVQDMLIYTYNKTTDTFLDVTSVAQSPNDSIFTIPTSQDSCLYMASTKSKNGYHLKHHGIKASIYNAHHIDVNTHDITVTDTTVAGDYDYIGNYNDNPIFKRIDNSYYLFFGQDKWCFYDSYPIVGFKSRDAFYVSIAIDGLYIAQNAYVGSPIVNLNSITEDKILQSEYWNGDTSSWDRVYNMSTESGGSYLPTAEKLFQNSGSYQVRYNAHLVKDSLWDLSDPMALGTEYYWTRYRNIIDVAEQCEVQQVKLHTSRFEINNDGFTENFGKGRPILKLDWDAGLLQPAGASPGNQDIYLSDKLDVGRIENEFINGATDRIGFLSLLPLNLDTSTPIKLVWSVRTDDDTLGEIEWVIRWGYSTPNGNIFGDSASSPTTHATEQQIIKTVNAPLKNVEQWQGVDLDVSSMLARRSNEFPDSLIVTIERLGASDSHGGDVSLVGIAGYYIAWNTGGHI